LAVRLEQQAALANLVADLPTLPIDPDRLGQALANLLSNAVKFTPAGGAVSVSSGVDFLAPLVSTEQAVVRHRGVPLQRINEIVRGRRRVTPETAWLFSRALGTTPQFWLNLQDAYDLT
jgi:addiction module HigA family antidote